MSELLRALGERVHLGPAMARMADLLVDPAEPYELGLALSVWDSGSGILLSYNPRTRGTGARGRMQRALAQVGLPLDGLRSAMTWVPDDRCSTVLGLEWHAGSSSPVATLYLEEVSRFHTPAALARTTARLAGLAGLGMMRRDSDPGDPYIWALDLDRRGVRALKTYRLCQDQAAVLAAARAATGIDLDPPWGQALAGGPPASGFILQRRHRASARAPLKIYKTYPYQEGGGLGRAARETAELVAPLDHSGVLPLLEAGLGGRGVVPLTSVGMRLAEGSPRPVAVTAYWCLIRGPGSLR